MKQIMTLLAKVAKLKISPGGSAADVSKLVPHGVPALGLRVEGKKYFYYHHAHADTLDKVDPEELTRCTATMAVVAYVLADMPGRLGN